MKYQCPIYIACTGKFYQYCRVEPRVVTGSENQRHRCYKNVFGPMPATFWRGKTNSSNCKAIQPPTTSHRAIHTHTQWTLRIVPFHLEPAHHPAISVEWWRMIHVLSPTHPWPSPPSPPRRRIRPIRTLTTIHAMSNRKRNITIRIGYCPNGDLLIIPVTIVTNGIVIYMGYSCNVPNVKRLTIVEWRYEWWWCVWLSMCGVVALWWMDGLIDWLIDMCV